MTSNFCGINNFLGNTPQMSNQYLETRYLKSGSLVACSANVRNLNASKILINGEPIHFNYFTTGTDDLQVNINDPDQQIDIGQSIETNYFLAGQPDYSSITAPTSKKCTVLGITSNGFDETVKQDGVAIGHGSKLMSDAVSIGSGASLNFDKAISIGKSSVSGDSGIAIGSNAKSITYGVSIGHDAISNGFGYVSIGHGAGNANSTNCTLVGNGAGNVCGNYVTALGKDAGQGSPRYCIAIGYKSGRSTGDTYESTVCIGNNCARPAAPKRLAFGNDMEDPIGSFAMPNNGIPQAYIKFEWNGTLYYAPAFTTDPGS